MCALSVPAGDHQVTLGDHLVDGELGIREGGKETADMFLFAISASLLVKICGVVIPVIRGKQLLNQAEVPAVEHLGKVAAHWQFQVLNGSKAAVEHGRV